MILEPQFIKICFILIGLTVLTGCDKNKNPKAEIEQLIPPETSVVIKFYDYSEWEKKIQNQSFLSKKQNISIIKYFSTKEFKALLDIPENILWAYNMLGKDKLVKTLIFESQNDIELKLESKQSYKYDNVSIKVFLNEEQEFFLTYLGGHTIVSNSKIILENIIRNFKSDIKVSPTVKRFLEVLSDDTPSMVINTKRFSMISKNFFKSSFPKNILNLSNYIGFDLILNQETVLLSGIVFKPDDKSAYWTRFSKINASNSVVAEVIPKHFTQATSILISDYQQLFPLNEAVYEKTSNDSIWLNIKEVAEINLSNSKAMAFVSKNIDQTFAELEKQALPLKIFGSNQIYSLKKSLSFDQKLNSFISPQKIKYFVIFQDIIVGSNQLKTLEDIIIQVNNKNVLSQQANYQNHLKSLNTQSHILKFTALNRQKSFFESETQPDYKNAFKSIDWSEHELLISQLIVEDNFAYFNILQKQTLIDTKPIDVDQIIRLKPKEPIISSPQFFKNWKTGQQDVLYQDVNNVLRLFDTKGNLVWTKKLDSPIVGKISSIDIYQNTRLQMTFATQNKIYVLDKNGNEVSPFPIDFKNDITQELSVFDYDKNGRYRFVVVMDNKVRMYNKEGKRIRGFKFKKTKTPLAFPLKHIRIGRKDYILAQEESGQLHILSRTGLTRVETDDALDHKDNAWLEHDKHFISVDDKGQLLKISQSGKIEKEDKSWINPKFTANGKKLVVMSENKLHINNTQTELPYGVYTNPIFVGNYIGITDTQTQKVYIINTEGNIVNGFPIYGQKILDAYTKKDRLVILCQDENQALLVYQVQFN